MDSTRRATVLALVRRLWRSYLLAAAGSAVALLVSLLLTPIDRDDSVAAAAFLAVVGISGWYGGLGPALLVTVCGALALDYFFEVPAYTLEVTDPRTMLDLLSFLLVAILLGSMNARLRRARNRAEAAVLAREELLATVSHDLRTSLTAIKTSVSALLEPTVEVVGPTRLSLLRNVESEVDRLIHFATDALALSRLQAGIVAAPEWNALDDVVSSVVDRSTAALGDRPIQFNVPNTLPLVQLDAHLLDQALTALLDNVSVHTPPGTPIAIDARLCGATLRVEVSDAGPGVPAAARERIFAKYERIGGRTRGVGLGLAIARAATEAQGGRVWVEDSALGGARFVIVLPHAAERPARP